MTVQPEPKRGPWYELALRITKSERTYTGLAEKAWRNNQYFDAIRFRHIAEGLSDARDHMLAVAAEAREQAGVPHPNLTNEEQRS